jgi:hypothetical protein
MSYDFGKKKGMSPIEKKAKLAALKGTNDWANDAMKSKMSSIVKDPKDLKSHVAEMSKESGIDFKGDSDHIEDPQRDGNVVGRHISDENDNCPPDRDTSVYDVDLELERLMKHKLGRNNHV